MEELKPKPMQPEAMPSNKPASRTYSPAQKWLVLAMLILGFYFDSTLIHAIVGPVSCRFHYVVFFLCCLGAVAVLNGRRLLANRDALLISGCTIVLAGLSAFHPNMRVTELGMINFLALPALTMGAAVLIAGNYEKKREGALIASFFQGWFVFPFLSIPRFFGAGASCIKGARGSGRNGLIGFLVALPIVAIVLFLLSSADVIMGSALSRLFENLDLPDVLFRAVTICIIAMLVYSTVYSLTWVQKKPLAPYRPGALPPVVVSVTLVALIAIYVVFGCIQFYYLFGGRLPAEYTYSEYARQGFFELMWVAAINFTLFGVSLRYVKGGRGLKVLLSLLLVCTLLLLSSAITRLSLYMGAYGLTFNRIMPMWFMIYLCFLLVLCALRLYREKINLLHIAGLGFIIWYLLLNLPDWGTILLPYA